MEGRILTWQEVVALKEGKSVREKVSKVEEEFEIVEEKKSRKANLAAAKRNKNDESYTMLTDIEKELRHYKHHFKDKIVFCNCDDPEESGFWKYFELNFEELGLKKLISTHFDSEQPTYKLELFADINDDGKVNKGDIVKTPLKTNGDFRSPECIEILKECDIVVTNPPFSLFREFIAQLMEYEKKFLVLGNNNAVTYKEIFKLIKDNEIWLGYDSNKTMEFRLHPDYEVWKRVDAEGNKYGSVPAISWFTNLEHEKRTEDLLLHKLYKGNEINYPKYDNYDGIEVSKVADIPIDWDFAMGVPITFLGNYNPDQFELLCCMEPEIKTEDAEAAGKTIYTSRVVKRNGYMTVKVYHRFLIKRK